MYLFVDGFHKFCEIFLFFNCEIHSVHLRAFFNFYFHLLHRTYKLLNKNLLNIRRTRTHSHRSALNVLCFPFLCETNRHYEPEAWVAKVPIKIMVKLNVIFLPFKFWKELIILLVSKYMHGLEFKSCLHCNSHLKI